MRPIPAGRRAPEQRVPTRRFLSPNLLLDDSSAERLQRGHCRRSSHFDVLFLAADVHAAEAADRPHLEDIDIGRLLRLVGCQRCVGRRLALENGEMTGKTNGMFLSFSGRSE